MDEIKKYSKIFGLTPDLLTQILRHFKEKFAEVIIKSINWLWKIWKNKYNNNKWFKNYF